MPLSDRVDVSVIVAGSPADPGAARIGQEAAAALSRPGLSHEILFTGSPRDPGRALVQVTLAARGDVVVWTEPHYAAEGIPDLVFSLATADQAVGVAGVAEEARRPALRRVLRRAAELVTGARIPDLDSGFRAFRRSAGLRHLHLLPHGRPGHATLTASFLARGHEVEFVPVRGGSARRAAGGFWGDMLRLACYVNPVRALGAVAVAMLLLAVPGLVASALHPSVEGLLPVLGALQVLGAAIMAEAAVQASMRRRSPSRPSRARPPSGATGPFPLYHRWSEQIFGGGPDPALAWLLDPSRAARHLHLS